MRGRGGSPERNLDFSDLGRGSGAGCPRRNPRQLDGEDASLAGEVAHLDLAAVRADALAGDGEPEAQAAAILVSLLEPLEQLLGPADQAATLVLDRDVGEAGVRVSSPRHDRRRG